MKMQGINNKVVVFPLYKKAEDTGVFNADNGWLISAPTATGKSHIGLDVIRRNIPQKTASDIYLYLVPFKALAEEIFEKLRTMQSNHQLPDGIMINIKTGDYDKNFDLKSTDILVATYESLDGLIQSEELFSPAIIIADEFSILSDDTRGAKIESLLAYLTKEKPLMNLYALSAVLDDPQKIAKWLNLQLLAGTENDRTVKLHKEPVYYSEGTKGKGKRLIKLVKESLPYGNLIIFCGRTDWAEKLAFELSDTVASFMSKTEVAKAEKLGAELKDQFPYLVGLQDLLVNGVAYHHAGLEVELRKRIGEAFLNRDIRVICASPTLSAGVNLPARCVIVRDLRVSGTKRLTVAQMINMLGRAGRPKHTEEGIGYFLCPETFKSNTNAEQFVNDVMRNRVEKLESQIPKRMTNILYFILSTVARFMGITSDGLREAYNYTLAGHDEPIKTPFLVGKDLRARMEELVSSPDSPGNIDKRSVSINNNTILARGGSSGDYEISVSAKDCSCTCYDFIYRRKPAGEICKHIKQLQYDIVIGGIAKNNPEAKIIALDSLRESDFSKDRRFMLSDGIDYLISSGFLEKREEERLFVTNDGRQALANYLLDLKHVTLLRNRMAKSLSAKNEEEVIKWAIEDYRFSEKRRKSNKSYDKSDLSPALSDAVLAHILDKPYKALSQGIVQEFLNTKEQLNQMFTVYQAFCPKNNTSLLRSIKTAKRRVHYGCKTDLLPLMILNVDFINEAWKAKILHDQGIIDVTSLSRADPRMLEQKLNMSPKDAQFTVEKAKSIVGLISNFKYGGESADIRMLSIRTEVAIEDLMDYLLPKDVVESIRANRK